MGQKITTTSVIIDKSWGTQLIIILLSLGLIFVNVYVASIICMILCIYGLIVKNYFEPFYILGAILCAYLLMGGINFSLYRGTVDGSTLEVILMGIISTLVGAFLIRPRRIGKYVSTSLCLNKIKSIATNIYPPSLLLILLTMLPSLLGVFWLILYSGIPVLNPSSRFSASPWALTFMEMAIIPIMLLTQRIICFRSIDTTSVLIFLLLLLILIVPGYRGWLVIAFGVVAISLIQSRVMLLTTTRFIIGFIIFMLFVVGVDTLRRTSSDLLPIGEIREHYSAESLPLVLAPLHFSLRETIALSQVLIEKKQTPEESILLADLKTILPGKQISGGTMVAEVVGGRLQSGGLTPGALGVLYIELAGYGLLVLVVIGYIIGVVWKRSLVPMYQARYSVLFASLLMYFLHYFHRGIPKISYLIVPILFLLISGFGDNILRHIIGSRSPVLNRNKPEC